MQVINFYATDGVEWVHLNKKLKDLEERKRVLANEEIPRAEEASQAVIAELRDTEEKLVRFNEKLEGATRDLLAERSHRESVLGAVPEG